MRCQERGGVSPELFERPWQDERIKQLNDAARIGGWIERKSETEAWRAREDRANG